MRATQAMRLILYIVFTLSGAAGLMYEMIWSRYLALFLGHSAYAQVLVIAIFLGGMALGALLTSARSERWHDPLKWYVGAELAVGLIGLFFHEIYLAATGFAYETIFPALAGTFGLTLFKWTLAAALILPQSVLLGATFPLMAAGVLRRVGDRPGNILSILYFTNSLGAAIGVLVAGFYLLDLAGLPGTLLAAAMINLAVALITAAVSRTYPAGESLQLAEVVERSTAPDGSDLSTDQLVRLLLGVSFFTAVASFAYEIGWLRMLSLVLGSATHSFELMLSAFILGLALGAFWVRRRADRWRFPLRALGLVQIVMGFSALATLALYGASFFWMDDLLRTFARTDSGYVGFTLARYAICLAIMFPASFCAGMTLPLITRTLLVAGAGERSIGGVYGINTLGAILGVAAAGLLLMPWIGLKGLIVGGATLDMALGVAILVVAGRRSLMGRRLAFGALAFSLIAATVGTLSRDFDHRVVASGVYRRVGFTDPAEWEELFYKDGRTASVTVNRVKSTGRITIRTNGKPDASIDAYWLSACNDTTVRRPLSGDAATQLLAPLVALAHKPDAKTAAVVGQGSGLSSHYLLGSPELEELVTIEIEPEMIRGSRAFYPANRRVFDDARSEIVIEDAKTYFASASREYDVIFSEPSNPWVSGIASLFSTEFYAHVKRYLAEGGVFGQWLHLYEMNDALVTTVMAAIHENFDAYEIFLVNPVDMLVVASAGPSLGTPDWSIISLPPFQEDLCHAVPATAEALEATRVTHRGALAPLLDGWEGANSDFYPVLDLSAERARYLQNSATGFQTLPVEPFDVTAPFFRRRSLPGTGGSLLIRNLPRLRAVALAAQLRGVERLSASDSTAMASTLTLARHRLAQWNALLQSGEPPPDWKVWLENFRQVERDLHGGTAGYVDAELYRSSLEFMDRHEAPDVVRGVIAFRHGLAAWDFSEAADAARQLIAAAAHREGYISGEELMDGGVVALLLADDVAGASQLFEELEAVRPEGQTDLSSRLVEAYLEVYRNTRTGS